jgi:excisionase family DNA binding protein
VIDLATTTRLTLRVDECQELLGVSRRTIYHWLDNGKLQGVQSKHGYTQIDVESVRHRLAVITPPAARQSAHLHNQQV